MAGAERRVLAISGSRRSGSANSALCRTAMVSAPPGVLVEVYPDIGALPHFHPDDDRDPLPAAVAALRASIVSSDALLFCTPEYAGTMPGSLKNLLEWTVGGTEMSGKPVAWARVAPDPDRGAGAHAALATVLGYVQAEVVDAACRHIPIPRAEVGADGIVASPAIRAQISLLLETLLG